MNIRAANVEDKEVLSVFQKQLAFETEKLQLDENTLERGLQSVLADPSKGRYFVAEDNNRVIGCLMVTPEWSDWRNGTVWWIQSVYVQAHYRRKGVYRKLYSYIKDWVLANEEYKGIRLYVEKENTVAQQVYNDLGMDGDHYKLFEWMKL